MYFEEAKNISRIRTFKTNNSPMPTSGAPSWMSPRILGVSRALQHKITANACRPVSCVQGLFCPSFGQPEFSTCSAELECIVGKVVFAMDKAFFPQ
jgi:hypothetical protein